MMPSAVPPQESTDQKWQSLKKYIMRDRQRQKEEQEADAEVQRQRREREQKQKQDVMTLGETKEQITELESRLSTLTEEKHQLFLSLKKVLNEDDSRRRQAQAIRESTSELVTVNASYPAIGGPLFLQPLQNRLPLYKVGPPTNAAAAAAQPGGGKRPRSPSPTSASAQPSPHAYHPYNNYKAANASIVHKQEQDGRRNNNEYVRAVLWNKGTAAAPYGGVYSGVYGVSPGQQVYSYAQPPSGAPSSYEPVYIPRQPSGYESKTDGDKVYLRSPMGQMGQMAVHPGQAVKGAFPVRASHQQHSVYLAPTSGTSSGRLLYGTAPTGPRYHNSQHPQLTDSR